MLRIHTPFKGTARSADSKAHTTSSKLPNTLLHRAKYHKCHGWGRSGTSVEEQKREKGCVEHLLCAKLYGRCFPCIFSINPPISPAALGGRPYPPHPERSRNFLKVTWAQICLSLCLPSYQNSVNQRGFWRNKDSYSGGRKSRLIEKWKDNLKTLGECPT